MDAEIISLLRRVDLADTSAASYLLCDEGQYAFLPFVLAVAAAIVGATTPKAYGLFATSADMSHLQLLYCR